MKPQTPSTPAACKPRWRSHPAHWLFATVVATAMLWTGQAIASPTGHETIQADRLMLAERHKVRIYINPHPDWERRDRWRGDRWRDRRWRDGPRWIPPHRGWTQQGWRVRVFHNPRYRMHRLDWCYRFGQQCGVRAAHAYCQMKGFRRAASYKIAHDVGPTRIIGTGRVCPHGHCDGYQWIRCTSRGSRY